MRLFKVGQVVFIVGLVILAVVINPYACRHASNHKVKGNESMLVVVDYIEKEAGLATLELEGKTFHIVPLTVLPKQVKEGDLLYYWAGKLRIDRKATATRRNELNKIMERLYER